LFNFLLLENYGANKRSGFYNLSQGGRLTNVQTYIKNVFTMDSNPPGRIASPENCCKYKM